jgi:hypothetical protein
MTLKNRMFVAMLSLASLGVGTLPLLGGAATMTAPFGDQAVARMGLSGESALFVEQNQTAEQL